jgi:hypothetical protein
LLLENSNVNNIKDDKYKIIEILINIYSLIDKV